MILVDTSIWVDHLREINLDLARLLENGSVLGHPFVTGEVALGTLRNRTEVLRVLEDLPQAEIADHHEVFEFINRHSLFGIGIGYVDAHLLASVQLTPGASLYTRDKRLSAAADRLRRASSPLH